MYVFYVLYATDMVNMEILSNKIIDLFLACPCPFLLARIKVGLC